MFESLIREYVCTRCGGRFAATALCRHFEKCGTVLRSNGGMAKSAGSEAFDGEGNAWCPVCFPDPETMHRGHRSVRRGDTTELRRVPGPYVSYGTE